MDMNERLLKNLDEKGPAAAKEWEAERQRNIDELGPNEYEKAKKQVDQFYKGQKNRKNNEVSLSVLVKRRQK